MAVNIKNTGRRTVRTARLFLKGCGCGGKEVPRLVLQPGQKGHIVHQLETKGSRSVPPDWVFGCTRWFGCGISSKSPDKDISSFRRGTVRSRLYGQKVVSGSRRRRRIL